MVDTAEGQPTTWKFTQCFGDKGDVEDITEGTARLFSGGMDKVWRLAGGFDKFADYDQADIISTVEFDQTGNYLATGDKGGRVVLFERNDTVHKTPLRRQLSSSELLLTRTEKNMRV